jgi:lysine/ornithine N-monooxygenase
MKKIKLFHFYGPKYGHVIAEIEKSKRRNILQNAVSVYSGIGRYAALSADDEIHKILRKAGCHELSQEHTMLKAIAGDPEVFQFCYGNKDLALHHN